MVMMLNALKSLFKRRDPDFVLRQVRSPARYEREKAVALSGDPEQRMNLARSRRTHQEILYYMAENDPDPAIRQAVARNLVTPVQASAVMSGDTSADVRLALAERLVLLLPELSREDYSQLYAIAVQALGALARDEVLKIRTALSSALRDHAYAPPAVAAQLARDVERQVAEPILRFCTALPDAALLDILNDAPEDWIIEAIASRKTVSAPVSVAVIGHEHPESGRTLIANPGAALSPELLRDIVTRARHLPEWRESLALRRGLPPEISKALAGYARESVQHIMARRRDFNRHTRADIGRVFQRRLLYANESDAAKDDGNESPYDRAVRLARSGALNEKIIADALAMHETDFVIAAIACRARTSLANVKRIFALQAARPIVTLSWQAGLSMRMALQLQKEMGRVPFRELVYPRDGTDYPLSDSELRWESDFLGLATA